MNNNPRIAKAFADIRLLLEQYARLSNDRTSKLARALEPKFRAIADELAQQPDLTYLRSHVPEDTFAAAAQQLLDDEEDLDFDSEDAEIIPVEQYEHKA